MAPVALPLATLLSTVDIYIPFGLHVQAHFQTLQPQYVRLHPQLVRGSFAGLRAKRVHCQLGRVIFRSSRYVCMFVYWGFRARRLPGSFCAHILG